MNKVRHLDRAFAVFNLFFILLHLIGCGEYGETSPTKYIWVEFGTTTVHASDNTIRITLTFYANSELTQKQSVFGFDREDCRVTRIDGDDISDMFIDISGLGADYTLSFKPKLERKGAFSVNIYGDIFSTNVSGDTLAMNKIPLKNNLTAITIKYNSVIPYIEDSVITIDKNKNRLDILMKFNIPVSNLSWDDIQTTGYDADIGIGTVFRATTKGEVFTEPTTNPPSEEWLLEKTETITPGMYFLIRYNVPKEGVVHFFLKEGAVYNAYPIIFGYQVVM